MAGRIVTGVVGLLVGVFVGTVTTVLHQSMITVVGVRLPWGIAVAFAAVVLVLLGMRWLSESRLSVSCCAIGVILPVVVFALPGLGGSVIIPLNIYGITWAVAAPLIAVFIALWPHARRRRTNAA